MVALMMFPVRPVWAGPSRVRESVTIVTSAPSWATLRAAWDGALRTKIGDPSVAWDREIVLVLAGHVTDEHIVALMVSRLERTGDHVAIDVILQSQPTEVWAHGQPTLVVVAPRAAFAGTRTIQLRWNGAPWTVPVHIER